MRRWTGVIASSGTWIMGLDYRCGQCGRTYPVAQALVGRKVRCTGCGRVDRVPEPDAPDPLGAYDLVPAAEEPSPRVDVPSSSPARASKRRADRARWLASWREPSAIQEGSVALMVLATADLFVTYALLRRGAGAYEANPVANWFFARWNMAGMTLFKFAAMGGVIALAEFIERRKAGRGKLVLLVGCLATAAVVIHGLRLLLGPGAGSPGPGE